MYLEYTTNLQPSEYISWETKSPIIIFVIKQEQYIIVRLKFHHRLPSILYAYHFYYRV